MRCRALAVLLLAAAPLRANVGPPSSGGQVVREPAGLEQVTITGETLTIDLRPLADGQPAHVEAVYHVDNSGPERALDLRFVAGSPVGAFEVRLDDQVVPSGPADKGEQAPESWRPPKTTPGLDGPPLGYLQYNHRQSTALALRLTLPPGRHTLVAKYDAEAARHHARGPTVTWQLAYVLAPARVWAGFGGLDVTVNLPTGWRAATDPPLDRAGDDLRGRFDSVPAEAVALTVLAPPGAAYDAIVFGSQAALLAVGVVGAVVCGRGGWVRGRRGGSAWAAVAGYAVLWGVLLAAAGAFAVLGPQMALPAGQANNHGYGQAFALIGVAVIGGVAVPAGFAIGMVCASLAGKKVSSEA